MKTIDSGVANESLLTPKEAASLLRVSTAKLRSIGAPAVVVSVSPAGRRTVRYDRAQLRAWLAELVAGAA